MWDVSEVLVKRRVLDSLSRVLVSELEARKWDFDTICSMSNTGKPIAVLLLDTLPGPSTGLLTVDSENGRFFPRLPQAGERILLVDSTVQTGTHLDDVTGKIAGEQATAVGAVVFCLHDRLPGGKERKPIVEAWLHEERLLYVFKTSELYAEWQKSHS